jgi:hypothetical protein
MHFSGVVVEYSMEKSWNGFWSNVASFLVLTIPCAAAAA